MELQAVLVAGKGQFHGIAAFLHNYLPDPSLNSLVSTIES